MGDIVSAYKITEPDGTAGVTRPVPRFTARDLLVLAAVALAYFAAGRIGLTFAAIHSSATAVWPPTGIAIAVLVLLGFRAWPAIFVGALLVNVTTSGSVIASVGIAVGNTLEALAAAWLVHRFARGAACFDRVSDMFRFGGFAAAATTVGATIGTLSLAVTGQAAWASFAGIWATWWLGDLAGALIFAPPIVLWLRDHTVEIAPACELFLQRDEIDRVVALVERHHLVEDAAVRIAIEVAAVDDLRRQIEGVVVHENRAEYRPLRFQVMRQRTFGSEDGSIGHGAGR